MKDQSASTIWNKDFCLLLIINAFVFTSMHMLSTTIAKFSLSLSGTEAMAGLVSGAFSVSSILMRPVCGSLIERKKNQWIYLFSLLTMMVGILGYSISRSNAMLILCRLIHGVGWGFATTVGMTMAGNTAPEGKVGECMSVYGLANVLAMAIAPTLGLTVSETFGYPAMFLTAACVVLCGCIALFFIHDPTKSHPAAVEKLTVDRLVLREAVFPALVLLLCGMAYTAITTFLVVYSQGAGIEKPSRFFSVYSVVILCVRLVSGRIVDRKGPGYIIIPSGFFFVGCLCLLGSLKTQWMLYAAAVCLGFGYSATLSTLMAVAFMRTVPKRRGTASSTINIGMDVGTGLGSTVAGLLAMRFGYSSMYYFLCIPVILAVLLFAFDQYCFRHSLAFYKAQPTVADGAPETRAS